MNSKKTSFFLIALGLILSAFSFFVTSDRAVQVLHEALRSGKSLDEDVLFWLRDLRSSGVALGALIGFLGMIRLFAGDRIRSFLYGGAHAEIPIPASVPARSVELFLISALCLFTELLVIRWLSVEMRVFAYFKNVPLISCFLGLGLGVAMAGRKGSLRLSSFPAWFALFSLVVAFLGPRLVFLNPAGADDFIWGIGRANSAGTYLIALFFFIGIFILIFVWNTRLFMVLGQMLGERLNLFRPLTGYSIDIAGSLVGIWLFTIVSYFWTPPLIWFGIAFIIFLFFLRFNRRLFIAMLAVSAAFCAFLVLRPEPHQVFWSPYYKIDLKPLFQRSVSTGQSVFAGYGLDVNSDNHQRAQNFSEEFVRTHYDKVPVGKTIFELPFRIRAAQDVLIVGAGTGSDAAAALRVVPNANIDAVEIDPLILQLGKDYHPEKPYDSERVRLFNDDARSYFKKTGKKYDLVVFGILDSHTQFSSFSNLRLDNYVYTQESLGDAKALLKPGGLVVITFGGDANQHWIGKRFYRMLGSVFGRAPVLIDAGKMVLVTGEDLDADELARNPYWADLMKHNRIVYENAEDIPPSTDDWPFLYMRERKVPKAYLWMIAALLAVSVAFTKRYVKELRTLRAHFFLLGTAFLLLETKAITELALVFGTTWLVNSMVFSGIMILILLGNFTVQRFPRKRLEGTYTLLAASLLFSYAFPLSVLTGLPFPAEAALALLITLLPVYFAAIIFATSFARTLNIPQAFGSNLLGAVFGGFMEYASLATGTKMLSLIALATYAASYLALRRSSE